MHGAQVTRLSTSPVGEGIGMLGILARVAITYDRPKPEAPPTVIAKFPSAVPGNRKIGMTYRLYEREVNFYTRVSTRGPDNVPDPTEFARDVPANVPDSVPDPAQGLPPRSSDEPVRIGRLDR